VCAVSEAIEIEPVPGWKGRARHGQRMTLTSYEIAAGAPDVYEHQHPQEEAWIVIEGQLEVWVDGEERVLGPGDSAIVAANMRHRVRALRSSRALVVDSPARRELPGTGH
jgi:quercetin dioxygenase-like cupin family protein